MRRPLALTILTFLCAVSLHALKLDVSAGFAGTGAPGAWIPVWIHSDQQIEGGEIELVRLDSFGIATGIERFPFNGSTVLEIPVLPEAGVAAVLVRLVLSGQIATERKIDFSGKLFPGHIVLAVDESPAIRSAIENLVFPIEPVRTVETGIADLPANALDYDAVSAIVVRDPGPVLSPAQRDALSAWLSAGGTMVVTELQPAPGASLWSQIAAETGASAKTGSPETVPAASVGSVKDGDYPDRARAVIGLGRLYGVPLADPLSFGIGGGPALNELMQLQPYEKSQRLRIGRIFAGDEKAKAGFLPPWMYALPFAFGLWAILLRWAAGSRRKALPKAALVTAASAVFALAGGLVIDSLWQRGSQTALHALVLPANGGVVADLDTTIATDRLIPAWSKPWSLSLGFGEDERGQLRPLDSSAGTWTHDSESPLFSLRTATRERIKLGAVLPVTRLNGSIPGGLAADSAANAAFDPGDLYLGRMSADGVDWRKRAGTSWIRVEQLAENFDRAWAERLLKAYRGQSWIFGLSDIPGLSFEIQNTVAQRYLWAIPAGEVPQALLPFSGEVLR